MKVFLLGAGGTGSMIAPVLCMLIGKENVVIIDGDELESKNLNRQLYDAGQVGQNKALALADKYGCDAIPKWYSFGLMEHDKRDCLIVAVDNHVARVAALMACDYEGCSAIFAANETHSSSAWVYFPQWKNTKADPRVMYPEMLTDHSGDPRAAAIGCTGSAQENNRQLASANFLGGGLAMQLYVLWHQVVPTLSRDVLPKMPHLLIANMTRLETHLLGELKDHEQED